uniref:Uncharacterized protein n=1 Tax=Romanomermis culicivorax TaxID=13658 RepID=A0A915L8F7_ROMCU
MQFRKMGTSHGASCDLKFEDDPVKSFSFDALDCSNPKSTSLQIEAAKRFDPLNFAFAKLECRWTRLLPSPDPSQGETHVAAGRFTYRYITYMSGKAEIRFARKKSCDTFAGVPLDCNLATPLSLKSPFTVTEIRISRYGVEKFRQNAQFRGEKMLGFLSPTVGDCCYVLEEKFPVRLEKSFR